MERKRDRKKKRERERERETDRFNYLNGRVSLDGLFVGVRDGDPEARVQNGGSKFDEFSDRKSHQTAKAIQLVKERNVRQFFAWKKPIID